MNLEAWIITGWAVASTWLTLVIVTHLLHWRATGFRPWAFLLTRHAVPYTSYEAARAVADERRRSLSEFLIGVAQERGGRVRGEFIEAPPGFPPLAAEPSSFGDDVYTASWHTARLNLQLPRDHHLLIERVTDAIVVLARAKELGEEKLPICIRLEPLPILVRAFSRSKFPWRVVIVSNEPESFSKWFGRLKSVDWFGIGVDVVPAGRTQQRPDDLGSPGQGPTTKGPTNPTGGGSTPGEESGPALARLGKCVAGSDGLVGVVGGLVFERGTSGQRFGVTCRHVLSSTCGSVFWPHPVRPPGSQFLQDSPDLAVITTDAGCFCPPHVAGQPVLPVTQADIELAVASRTPVAKSADPRQMRGRVQMATVAGFKLGACFYRGIHFQLTPWFQRRFGIVWPLFRNFTEQGDSGSWIRNSETRGWMGMVVGGFRWPNRSSVALSSEYIIEGMRLSGKFAPRLDSEVLT